MAASGLQTFRFLDLPAEIRRLVYEGLFHGSEIIISNPTKDMDESFKIVNLASYHRAITFVSHVVRAESVHLLDQATNVVLRGEPERFLRRLPEYLETCPVGLLRRITWLRWEFDLGHKIYGSLMKVIDWFPELRTLEVCQNLATEACGPIRPLDMMEAVNRGDMPFDMDEYTAAIGGVDSIKALSRHGRTWIKTVMPEDCEALRTTLQLKTMVITTYLNPGKYCATKLSQLQYALMVWDGQELQVCKITRKEAKRANYDELVRRIESK